MTEYIFSVRKTGVAVIKAENELEARKKLSGLSEDDFMWEEDDGFPQDLGAALIDIKENV